MHVKDWRACESKVADTVDRGEIASLLFGFNHHILGCRAKCQMLFVQVVKAQKEVHGDYTAQSYAQEKLPRGVIMKVKRGEARLLFTRLNIWVS